MGSEKAWYWIAVAVLAVFAINNFAARHQDGVRCLASRSLAALEQDSGRVGHVIALAELTLGRGETRFDQAQMALDGMQTRLALAQTVLVRHEAVLARVQAEHARLQAMQQLSRTVICPRQNLRIVIPAPPVMRTDGTI